jgi:hypothetical protein
MEERPVTITPETDDAALTALKKKLALVRDRVTAVATGLQWGFYLFGAGGIGKSHTVQQRPAGARRGGADAVAG